MAEGFSSRAALFWGSLAALALALSAARIHAAWPPAGDNAEAELARVILEDAVLPRVLVALFGGAMLGLSGVLLQGTLRNALAEPSTLGIAAGAQLALTLAALHAPFLIENFREPVALAGGAAATALVLLLNWRGGLEPVSVVLSGMTVSLAATAASAAVILANGEYMLGLFIWGGGSLVQDGWGPALGFGWRLALGGLLAFLLLRPLTLLGLDDASARGLGLGLFAARLATLGLAVWLAASVTAEVGVIGFVGLAAPALARLSGARSLATRLWAAPLAGALLLWLADGLVQVLDGWGGGRVPAGAATALLGGPLLFWLLPRLRMTEWPSLQAATAQSRRIARPLLVLLALGLLLALVAAFAIALGQGREGWTLASEAALADILPWRGPRVALACAAGAMLGVAGVILQRFTANPLASPEILGVGAGAGVGLTLALALLPDAGLAVQFAASSLGAVAVLSATLLLAARSRFGPERLLLGGVAAGAFCSAVLTAVIATGNRLAFSLLGWLSGSTAAATPAQAWFAGGAMILLLAPLPFLVRWLDTLPLGGAVAQAIGVPVARARAILVLLAGLLTAAAALFVGPLSFVGLIAPHLARLIGFGRAGAALPAAALIGAILLVFSDWLSRSVAFPYQLPLGLVATLTGGPYLVWQLAGRTRRT